MTTTQLRKMLATEINLAGVNMAVGATGIAMLNNLASIPEPNKTLVMYGGLFIVAVIVSYVLTMVLRKKAKQIDLQKSLGLGATGLMVAVVTSEYAKLIVPHYGYSISSLSVGGEVAFGVSALFPFIIVSIMIIVGGYLLKRK